MPFEKGNKLALGRKVSEETRKKISLSLVGRFGGDKNPMYGKKHSLKSRKKISKIHKGKTPWNKGIPRTEITKQKIRETKRLNPQKGYWIGKKRKPFSKKWKKKMSLSAKPNKTGAKNPAWKGGITPLHRKIRTSAEYRNWRDKVFKRDKYICVWCGFKGYVQADHIKPFAKYPKLRFKVSNGRTLCVPCHKKTESYGRNIK